MAKLRSNLRLLLLGFLGLFLFINVIDLINPKILDAYQGFRRLRIRQLLKLSPTASIQIRDPQLKIHSSVDGQLDIEADTEVEITATTIDLNGNVIISGTVTLSSAISSTSSFTLTDTDEDSLTFDPSALNVIHYRDGATDLFVVDSTGKTTIAGSTGLLINGANRTIQQTDNSNNAIDLDNAHWKTASAGILVDVNTSGAAVLTLGQSGDDDTVRVEGEMDISGKLGVATTTPLKLLDVAGSTRIKGTGTVTLTGTIDPAASVTVAGVGTLFLTELVIGDQLVVTGENRTVTAIASNIELTVDAAFTDNANDTSPDKIESHLVITDSGGTTDLVVDADGNMGLGVTNPTSRLHLPLENDAVTPTFSFGDGNTGFYESADNDLSVAIAGSRRFFFTADQFAANVGFGGVMLNENATATNPTLVPDKQNLATGIGSGGVDTLSFIVNSTNAMNILPTGNVGIGTTAPRGLLDLDKAALADTMFIVDNDVSGDLDSTILVLADASINKPAGAMQFDVASGALFVFGENGTNGIQLDGSLGRVRGGNSADFIDIDSGLWQAQVSMKADPVNTGAGVYTHGETGDNDTVKVVGVLELNDAALHAPDYAGVSVNDNGSATDIALVDAWEKYLHFDTNSPEAVSDGDNTSNDITIGATGVYDIRFYLSGSSANVNKVFEYTIFELNATATAITAATAADPVVITAAGHGFSNGNKIAIKIMDDMVEVNDRIFTVQDVSGATFELTDDGGTSPGDDIDGTGFTPYVSGGTVQLVTELDVHSHRKYAVANDIGHAGGGNFASLAASRTLELYMKNVTDADNPTLENVILLMKRID